MDLVEKVKEFIPVMREEKDDGILKVVLENLSDEFMKELRVTLFMRHRDLYNRFINILSDKKDTTISEKKEQPPICEKKDKDENTMKYKKLYDFVDSFFDGQQEEFLREYQDGKYSDIIFIHKFARGGTGHTHNLRVSQGNLHSLVNDMKIYSRILTKKEFSEFISANFITFLDETKKKVSPKTRIASNQIIGMKEKLFWAFSCPSIEERLRGDDFVEIPPFPKKENKPIRGEISHVVESTGAEKSKVRITNIRIKDSIIDGVVNEIIQGVHKNSVSKVINNGKNYCMFYDAWGFPNLVSERYNGEVPTHIHKYIKHHYRDLLRSKVNRGASVGGYSTGYSFINDDLFNKIRGNPKEMFLVDENEE